MIKKVIKKQIRKTGLVKELEKENKNLKLKIDILEKENQKLLSDNSEIVGYSLNCSLRD